MKVSRQVLRKWPSTNVGVKHVLRNKPPYQEQKLDRSTQLLRSYRGNRNFLYQSTRCQGGVKIAIRKSLEARQIARCQGGIEEVSRQLKNCFSRREKHRYECNQACNLTKDLVNILSSQNHLLTKILSTMIPKTHTHTRQV